MAKQKQAEECVLYVRVSTTRQAEDGSGIRKSNLQRKITQVISKFIFPEDNSSMTERPAKVPLKSQDLLLST